MFCEKCGSQALDGSVFCINCGAKLDNMATETTAFVTETNLEPDLNVAPAQEEVIQEEVIQEAVIQEAVPVQEEVMQEEVIQEAVPVQEEVIKEVTPVQAAAPAQEVAPTYTNNSGAYYQSAPEYSQQNAMYMQNAPVMKKEKKGGFPIAINILLGLLLFFAIVLLVGVLVAGSLISKKTVSDGEEQASTDVLSIPEEELLENQSTVSQVLLEGVTYNIPVETPEVSLQDQIEQEYILANSDSVYYTKEEINALSDEDLQLARNEIYARYGRMFKDQEIQDYFDAKSWYYGYYEPDDFDQFYGNDVLNDYELANLEIIVEIEEERGL